jgi:hypothetical protein
MEAGEERAEVEPVSCRHDKLAVEDEAVFGHLGEILDELGKVAREGTIVAASQVDIAAVPENEAAKPVPLGLIESIGGQLAREPSEHRLHRRHDGKLHPCLVATNARAPRP